MPTAVINALPNDPPNWIRAGEPVDGETNPGVIQPQNIVTVDNRPARDLSLQMRFLRDEVNLKAQPRYPFSSTTICADITQEYFVDSIGGNDANDGLSAVTPFQTLQKVFGTMRSDAVGILKLHLAKGTAGTPKTYGWPVGYDPAFIAAAYFEISPFPGTVTTLAQENEARDFTTIDMSALRMSMPGAGAIPWLGGFTFTGAQVYLNAVTLRSPYYDTGDFAVINPGSTAGLYAAPAIAVRGGCSCECKNVRFFPSSLATRASSGPVSTGLFPDPFLGAIGSSLIGVYGGKLTFSEGVFGPPAPTDPSAYTNRCVVNALAGGAKGIGIALTNGSEVSLNYAQFLNCSAMITDSVNDQNYGGAAHLGNNVLVGSNDGAPTIAAALAVNVLSNYDPASLIPPGNDSYSGDVILRKLPITPVGETNVCDFVFMFAFVQAGAGNTFNPWEVGPPIPTFVKHNMKNA